MPAPLSHTVLVHDAVDLAALAATLDPSQVQELIVLEEQHDQPRFAVRYGGKRRPGHVRLTAAQQKALRCQARIPVTQTHDLLRPWPVSTRRPVVAVDAAGSWPAAEPEAAIPAWIVFDGSDAFERTSRMALGLGASGMGSCRIQLPQGAWRARTVWMLHLPSAPRFVLLTAQDEGHPVLVHDTPKTLVPWGTRLVLPQGYPDLSADGHLGVYLHAGASRIDVPVPRTIPVSSVVLPEAGVPLSPVVATPASPPEPFKVRVGIYPSHSPRDPRLWLLRGAYAHAKAERVLEAVPQDEYASIQVAVLRDPQGDPVVVLREAHQGKGRSYFDFSAEALQLAPLAGLPNLHIPFDYEVQPVLSRESMAKIFGLEASKHTLVLPPASVPRGEAPQGYELLTVRELDFAPLGSLISHILHASRQVLGAIIARSVFDFSSFMLAEPMPREQAPAAAVRRYDNAEPPSGPAHAPVKMEKTAPEKPAPSQVPDPQPAEPSAVLIEPDVWEAQRRQRVIAAHDNNDLPSWRALLDHMAQRCERTQARDAVPSHLACDWLDAAIQVCLLDPCVQAPASRSETAWDTLRAQIQSTTLPVARRILAPILGKSAEDIGLREVIMGLDAQRGWMNDLPASEPSKPDPAHGRAIAHRETLHALTLMLGLMRWSAPGFALDPFEVPSMPEIYAPPERPEDPPRMVYPPDIGLLMRCVSAKVSALFGVLARSPRSPWYGTGHAVASEYGLRRVLRSASGPIDELRSIRTGYLQGLVGAGTDDAVGKSAELVRWLGDIIAGRRSSVDQSLASDGPFDPYMATAANVITAYGLAQLGLAADASSLLESSRGLCESGFAPIPSAPSGVGLNDGDSMLPGVYGAYASLLIQGNFGRIDPASDAGRWLGRTAARARRDAGCAAENIQGLAARMELLRTAEPDELWRSSYAQAERVFVTTPGYTYLREIVWPGIEEAVQNNDPDTCARRANEALYNLPLLPRAQSTRRGQSLGMGEAGYLLLRLSRLIPQLGIAAQLRPGLDHVIGLVGTADKPGALGEINMSNGLMRVHLAGCLAKSGDHAAASAVLVALCDGSWKNHRVSQLLDLYEVLTPVAHIISGLDSHAREPAFMALVAASHIDRPLPAGGRDQVKLYRTNRSRMTLALIECLTSKANRVEGLHQWMAQDEVHYMPIAQLLRD